MRLATDLRSASRCPTGRLPPVRGIARRNGINYQKKLDGALSACAKRIGATYEPEPWFAFHDAQGPGQAVPDGLFIFGDRGLIIEVKYSFVLEGPQKLSGLYLPVASLCYARSLRLSTLVICKNLNPLAKQFNSVDRLSSAFVASGVSVLNWLGHGPIDW